MASHQTATSTSEDERGEGGEVGAPSGAEGDVDGGDLDDDP